MGGSLYVVETTLLGTTTNRLRLMWHVSTLLGTATTSSIYIPCKLWRRVFPMVFFMAIATLVWNDFRHKFCYVLAIETKEFWVVLLLEMGDIESKWVSFVINSLRVVLTIGKGMQCKKVPLIDPKSSLNAINSWVCCFCLYLNENLE